MKSTNPTHAVSASPALRRTILASLSLCSSLLCCSPLQAHEHESGIAGSKTTNKENLPIDLPAASKVSHHPDSHAPIGVMGDHMHKAGEWMLSYRYMYMRMEGTYNGSSEVSEASQLLSGGGDFAVMPTDMDMHMHMFGFMYAPTDWLTFMAMTNYTTLSMNHITAMGRSFSTQSEGFGDTRVGGLFRLLEKDGHHAHFGLNLIIPTGDIDNRDATPLNDDAVLPYPMQLGSASWGLEPSLTYTKFFDNWSLGAQAKATFYLADNEQDYRLGNRGEITTWAAYQVSENFSLSARLAGSTWEDIEGEDSRIARRAPNGALLVPTAQPELRGGSRLDGALGVNFRESYTGIRLGVEVGKTLWQNLDGPQLGNDYWATVGVQYSW